MSSINEKNPASTNIKQPFANLDGRNASIASAGEVVVASLQDADEALAFLENHPRAAEIAIEGQAILDDPVLTRKLLRKIDFTICPLLAAVYFLQFLDKTTLSYTAVMGIRADTHLKGQDYSNLSMLFYIGTSDVSLSVYLKLIVIPRFPCNRVPNSMACSEDRSSLLLPQRQHHALGCHPHVPRCMHFLRRSCHLPYPSRCL